MQETERSDTDRLICGGELAGVVTLGRNEREGGGRARTRAGRHCGVHAGPAAFAAPFKTKCTGKSTSGQDHVDVHGDEGFWRPGRWHCSVISLSSIYTSTPV